MPRRRHHDFAPSARALSPRVVARIGFLLVLMMAMGIAHLQLRFMLNEMRRETIRLQTDHSRLASEINALQGETEALKQPERLFEFARAELGMVPYSPEQREVVQMPQEIFARYAMARSHQAAPDAETRTDPFASRETAQAALLLDLLGQRIGLVSEAYAEE